MRYRFYAKQPEEIRQIIEEKLNEHVCGRFYNHQIQIDNLKSLPWKDKFFSYIPAQFQNNRITLALFPLILFLTGCSKPTENCVSTMEKVIAEEDLISKNNGYTMGEALIINDSVAQIRHNDSLKLHHRK